MNILGINLDEIFVWVTRASLYAVAVIAITVLVQMLTRRALSAKWIYALWIVLLLRLLIPMGPESGWSLWNLASQGGWVQQQGADPGNVSVTVVSGSMAMTDAALIQNENYSMWPALRAFIPVLWLAGALLTMCGIIIGNLRLWNTVRRLPFVTDHALLELFEECRQSMRVQTVVGLIVTDRVKSPVLFGFIRPRVLLPADLVRELPPERLRYIMLHELAHLKRHDILTGWVLAFLQSLHWFNPLVWWAFRRMRFDRELACDEQVLSRVQETERRHYGDVLIGMLERFNHIHHLPAIAGILENKDQLKRRLVMIRKFRRPARREIIAFAALLAVLSIALLTEPQSLLSQSENNNNAAAGETATDATQDGNSGSSLIRISDPVERQPERQSLETGSIIRQPVVLAQPRPDYTQEARQERIEGTILLDVTIFSDGTVGNVKVARGLRYDLDESAINTVTNRWRFQPATRDGVPIDYPAMIEVQFALGGVPNNIASQTEGYLGADGVRRPLALARPAPNYTEAARNERIEGTVILEARIHSDGTVGIVKVARGLGYGLDEAAIDAVKNRWRFQPATRDGVPIDWVVAIEVQFSLGGAANTASQPEASSEVDDFMYPVVLTQPKPDYTEEARDARIEGTILLSVTVFRDGSVGNIRVEKGLGYGLDESAINIITNKWRFRPATRDGVPIDYPAMIEVQFTLM